ncbi:hypothetical protein IWQ61_000439 [Dispira simplex]|nr:hypothetical protein IWQ61_000439 [Dispira simplex]
MTTSSNHSNTIDTLDKTDADGTIPNHSQQAKLSLEDDPNNSKKSFFGRLRRKPGSVSSPAVQEPKVSFIELFKYADTMDWLLLIAGFICSLATGVSQPLMAVVLSSMLQGFNDYTFYSQLDRPRADAALNTSVYDMMKWFGVLTAGTFAAGMIQIFCWSFSAERQCRRIRERYYVSILRQDMAWHDCSSTGDLTARISGDVNMLQEGIGSKLGLFVQHTVCFLAGFVIAFSQGWRLALVMLCALPLLAACGGATGKLIASQTSRGQSSYAGAGAVAEEVISGIRTVMAFGGQAHEVKRYQVQIKAALQLGLRKAWIIGLGVGFMMLFIFLTYALGFWYGIKLASEGSMNGTQVLTVFFALVIGAMSLGNAAPDLSAVAGAQGAAAKVFHLIERVSDIDPLAPGGKKIDQLQGRIEFRNVKFNYPTRPDVPILGGFDLTIEPGQTVALVGTSGSGKSTIVSLLERFYDPLEGDIFLDGVNLRDLNVRFLRSQIGFVSQEPILFGSTVRQNILWGALEDRDGKVTEAQLKEASVDANAYDFISRLPQGFESLVGEKGSLLSGGQKQRVAIARAIIRNPRILLLDEATSALDSKSERLVQDALDRASKNRTTIVIAHRLSTIRDADKIVVMSKGEIVEVGTHNSLLAKGGAYAQLVQSQTLKKRQVEMVSDESSEEWENQDQDEPSGDGEVFFADLDSTVIARQENEAPVRDSSNGTYRLLPTREVAISDDTVKKELVGDDGAKPTMIPLVEEKKRSKRGLHALSRQLHRRQRTKPEADKKEDEEKVFQEAERTRLAQEPMPLRRVAELNRPEIWYIVSGTLFCVVDGAIMPCFSILFSKIITVFSIMDNPEKMRKDGNLYALLFVMFGVVSFISATNRIALFEVSGERLTYRLRHMSFKSIIYQDAEFFDNKLNGTGTLCSKLATEAEQIKTLSGKYIGTLIRCASTLVVGLALAFTRGWQLTLVVLACLPILVGGSVLRFKAMSGFDGRTKKAYDQAAQTAAETVSNLRTVAMLTRENTFIQLFHLVNEGPHRIAMRGFVVDSAGSAFSQCQQFLVLIIAFYYGSRLVIKQTYTVEDMLQVIYAVIFAAMGLGMASQQLGDLSKAKVAALSLFEIVDRCPSISVEMTDGKTTPVIQGHVDAHQIDFSYPTAPHVPILNQVNIQANPGQTVALVGNSGSGKSTMVALVQRLYDVLAGSISVEHTDVREWNLKNIRSHMALVGQEPVLFDLTIRENIRYGKPDATDEEVEDAARAANIHIYIQELPQQYSTKVGERGGQLSGGQKQRIAIARALIRNPKLLLLDEATSALDSQSERIVQETLDKARKGRTTLTIAHRLSTIQDADIIVVFENGRVVEQGTHFELVDNRGLYYSLVQQQSLAVTH